jgi:hypothetical protein
VGGAVVGAVVGPVVVVVVVVVVVAVETGRVATMMWTLVAIEMNCLLVIYVLGFCDFKRPCLKIIVPLLLIAVMQLEGEPPPRYQPLNYSMPPNLSINLIATVTVQWLQSYPRNCGVPFYKIG